MMSETARMERVERLVILLAEVEGRKTAKCSYCGKIFILPAKEQEGNLCMLCQALSNNINHCVCQWCGREFEVRHSHPTKWCLKCKVLAKRERQRRYREKLRLKNEAT